MQSSWTGRTDGTTPEHLRWHQVVRPYGPGVEPGACVRRVRQR